jgi:tRNA(Ile)-lysidine synthase
MNHFVEEKFIDNLNSYSLVDKNEAVLIGVSGGADSLALLHLFMGVQKSFGITLYAVHVNHMLRGKESEADQNFVEEHCRYFSIPLVVHKMDVAGYARRNRLSIEEAARVVRYEVFEKEAHRIGECKIAVAHHADDQAETLCMNLMRGTGPEGLLGMRFLQDGKIRPLLNIPKSEILSYVLGLGLFFRQDASNLESIFTRNRVRLEWLPFILEKFGVDLGKRLISLSEILRDENDWMEACTLDAYRNLLIKEDSKEIIVRAKHFNTLHRAIKKRMVRHIVRKLKGNLKNIEKIHIEDVLRLAQNGKNGSKQPLPQNMYVHKMYEEIRFYNRNIKEVLETFVERAFEWEANPPALFYIKGFGEIEMACFPLEEKREMALTENHKDDVQYFDYNKIKAQNKKLWVRNRRVGDRIKLFENGHKKLKKYFTDAKIEASIRDSIPLLAMENEILWILGHGVTIQYAVDDTTKEVLKVWVKNRILDKK